MLWRWVILSSVTFWLPIAQAPHSFTFTKAVVCSSIREHRPDAVQAAPARHENTSASSPSVSFASPSLRWLLATDVSQHADDEALHEGERRQNTETSPSTSLVSHSPSVLRETTRAPPVMGIPWKGEMTATTIFKRFTVAQMCGVVLIAIACTIAVCVGVGGGGMFVPILILMLGFSTHAAIGIAQSLMVGGTLAGLILNWRQKNPACDRPIIDVTLVLLLGPMQIAGTGIGVLINSILSSWTIILCTTCLLGVTGYKTFWRGIETYKKDKQARAEATTSSAQSHLREHEAACLKETRDSRLHAVNERVDVPKFQPCDGQPPPALLLSFLSSQPFGTAQVSETSGCLVSSQPLSSQASRRAMLHNGEEGAGRGSGGISPIAGLSDVMIASSQTFPHCSAASFSDVLPLTVPSIFSSDVSCQDVYTALLEYHRFQVPRHQHPVTTLAQYRRLEEEPLRAVHDVLIVAAVERGGAQPSTLIARSFRYHSECCECTTSRSPCREDRQNVEPTRRQLPKDTPTISTMTTGLFATKRPPFCATSAHLPHIEIPLSSSSQGSMTTATYLTAASHPISRTPSSSSNSTQAFQDAISALETSSEDVTTEAPCVPSEQDISASSFLPNSVCTVEPLIGVVISQERLTELLATHIFISPGSQDNVGATAGATTAVVSVESDWPPKSTPELRYCGVPSASTCPVRLCGNPVLWTPEMFDTLFREALSQFAQAVVTTSTDCWLFDTCASPSSAQLHRLASRLRNTVATVNGEPWPQEAGTAVQLRILSIDDRIHTSGNYRVTYFVVEHIKAPEQRVLLAEIRPIVRHSTKYAGEPLVSAILVVDILEDTPMQRHVDVSRTGATDKVQQSYWTETCPRVSKGPTISHNGCPENVGVGAARESARVVADLLRREASRQYDKWILLTLIWAISSGLLLLRGGKRASGLVPFCGVSYWGLFICSTLFTMFCSIVVARYVTRLTKLKLARDYPFVEGEIVYTPSKVLSLLLQTFLAGVAVVGIGGGMILGPLMLSYGLSPQVTTAANSTLVLFASSSAALSFIVSGQADPVWSGFFFVTCFTMSLIGKFLLDRFIKRHNLSSVLVFLLLFIITLSLIALLVSGIRDIAEFGFTGLQSPCT